MRYKAKIRWLPIDIFHQFAVWYQLPPAPQEGSVDAQTLRQTPWQAGATIYGIPASNYTQGLIINRKLFTRAGLNPNHPPATWAQVEKDATAIARLGHGIDGYGEHSAGNDGGWHFSSEIGAEGGQMTNSAGTAAAFDSPQGKAVLQALHTLRFSDHAMSSAQQLAWGALQKQMAAGDLGMYIAAPDDIYDVIVPEDGGNINDYGMGPLPSTTGQPARSPEGDREDHVLLHRQRARHHRLLERPGEPQPGARVHRDIRDRLPV